jgi:rhodanese-related sulfurtransferase
MVKRIDVDELLELVRDGAQLIDVLPASTYEQVHLPSAQSQPLELFDESTRDSVDLSRAIVVYCFDQH